MTGFKVCMAGFKVCMAGFKLDMSYDSCTYFLPLRMLGPVLLMWTVFEQTVSLVRRIIRYYTISLLTISYRMGRIMTLSTMFSNNYSLCNTFVKNVVIYFCFLTADNRFVLIEVPLPRQTSQCPSPRTCTACNGKPCMSRLI